MYINLKSTLHKTRHHNYYLYKISEGYFTTKAGKQYIHIHQFNTAANAINNTN